MGINITPLFWAITEKLKENLTPYEIQLYSKAIDLLKFGKLFTVPTFADLPSASNSTNGQLIFVEAENVLYTYKAVTGQWESVSTPIQSNMLLWGDNASSRLGIDSGNVFIYTSPVTVDVFNDWCDVSANFCHTAAVRTNGTLWTWGSNSAGRLGDGTIISRISPISVIGGFTDWCQVSAGGAHTTAVRSNGTLWTWGSNSAGRLGDGTTIGKSSPVSVVGGFTDWCQVNAGYAAVAAIRTNGTLWTWGDNFTGQLGNGTVSSRSSPVSVVGDITSWCAASIGRNAAFGITLLPVKGFDTL